MDSALSPREIQARIRAGESLESVAEAAGVPAEQVEPFAAPVIAEREHVRDQALMFPVRRQGESSSVRTLRQVTTEALARKSIEDVHWDAWRDADKRWMVVAHYEVNGAPTEARFAFDLRGRFSIARDETAQALISDPRSAAPARTDPPRDPDNEPTVGLDDRLPGRTPEFPARPVPRNFLDLPDEEDDAELTADDSRDDLVGHDSQLDVLYEMLSSFDEDSVNVYADLSRPVTDDGPLDDLLDDLDAQSEESPESDDRVDEPEDDVELEVTEESTSSQAPRPEEALVREEPLEESQAEPADERAEPAAPATAPTSAEPSRATRRDRRKLAAQADPSPAEPEQDPLVEVPEESKPTTRNRTRPRKGRASVPTWDEIVFGGPRSED